ncbi:multiple C2 and transmembrane domain-containing protein-like [Daphnia pulicaria]|uniref:multiple C2 and transmembrane domain-containing protein-like n=1 Tax=Daphnia pulicaria TaxID=35523 RepID=UPI001EEA4E31|nr:multiple C2 and transmembrane domain-containing protein-like [Daphnia pulicaria]
MGEPEAGSRRRQRLSQSLSALELSMVEFENDENHAARKPVAHLDATLPSEKPALHVLGDLSSSLSPSVRTLQSVGQQSTSARKSSPIRAFLTPPLMRKRKVPSSKHLHHDDDNGSDSRLSPHHTNTAGNVLPSSRSKSFGFLSLLKFKFSDRSGRSKQQPVFQSSSSVLAGEETISDNLSSATTFPSLCVDQPFALSPTFQERERCEQQRNTKAPLADQEDCDDIHPQLCASAGLSFVAVAAASTVIPRLAMPKKVSISSKHTFTPHSSLDHPSSADFKHGMVSTMPATSVSSLPPLTSMLQPGSIQLVGPFRLHVVLKQGRDLAAKDSCGTSDPYVKFKLGNKVIYRSKTIHRDLNPIWEEDFDIYLDDLNTPLHIRVFDYDWGVQDDFLGAATFDLNQLELNKINLYSLDLFTDEMDGRQGIIDLSIALYPKLSEDDSDQRHPSKIADQAKRLKVQIWSSIVNILIIEGRHLTDKDGEPLSKPYLRLRLANEKYKTKSVTRNSSNTSVTWLEQFDFHLYEDQSHILEINLHEKEWKGSLGRDESVARAVLDLAGVEGERTHSLNCEFQQGGSGSLSLLITISGTTASETISDLSSHQSDTHAKEVEVMKQRYSLWRTLNNLRDVGHLSVKVFRATGLASADIGGKSDPFCVLQLVNSRLQTQTEYKTLNPSWNKIFTFNVKDINSVLQVTVYDEDRDHRFEFLGAVSIPLLRIGNGQKRWYALKDRKLRFRAKGSNPQVLLELNVVWNEFRATIQTLQPKEKKYIEPELKFSRHTFVRNVMRVKAVVMDLIEIGKYIESIWEWESTTRSCIGFAVFLVVTWHFEPYVIPLMLLLFFLRNFLIRSFTHGYVSEYQESDNASGDDDDEEADDKNKEERKSLKERLHTIQEATLTVQNSIGYLASLFESVRNTFNFSVPFLSYLAIILLIASCILLYTVPLRFLILGWGVNKFTRKLFRPHSIPNNEALDFLSRVPDNEQLADYRELRLDLPTDHSDKSNRKITKKK